MIDHQTIERIKESARVEEVVGDFVSLHRKGGNFWGCCPFHNEKTPSFSVSPSKGFYKCFGCGVSGDSTRFLMEYEHYTYPEALRWLARKYNIEIVEEEQTEEQKQKNSERDVLYHVLQFAQEYYADQLFNDEMGRAVGLSYFHKRGMSDEIIKDFGLGYGSDEWRAFSDHAKKNGYSDSALEKSGLTIFKDGKYYDRFRSRVSFPIYSLSGRVLGFSCRTLSNDKSVAKYVNSPETEIYLKKNTLYGLFQAKRYISQADKCFLVEGNVDVISMHQSGLRNTVASCGTSLTSEQARLIARFTKNVTIMYDGDSAGIKAAQRAVGILYDEGLKVRMVLFPDGEDPDSYAQKYGSTKLQEYVEQNEENFILYKMRVTADNILQDPIRKSDFLHDMVATIAHVTDIIERNEYISLCASLFKTTEEVLANQLAIELNNRLIAKSKAKEPLSSQPTTQTTTLTQAPEFDPEFPELPPPGDDDFEPVGAKPTAPTQIPVHERHLIELLLNYGSENILVEAVDEENKIVRVMASVAEVIVTELESDEIGFSHPDCIRIYNYFREAILQEKAIPNSAFFVSSEDQELQTLAISFMREEPTISKKWAEKGMYVRSIADNLKEDVNQNILNFKLKVVESRIEEVSSRLKNPASDEDVLFLMAELTQLKKKSCEICRPENLHRIIIP